ncbi:MAG: hypothetical protein HS128_15415 [Ideonella sp.]|nr:hypothetical protein [Ideonella sp.]
MLHTFWVGNLRLVLDARHAQLGQTTPQATPAGRDGAAAGRTRRQDPGTGARGCSYDGEDVIDVCEQRDLRYLLRLRKTANVKRLIERLFRREDWTRGQRSQPGLAGHRGRIAPERLEQSLGASWCCAGASSTTLR